MSRISCCCFDLETSNLSADFGVLLCAVIKPANGAAKVFRADELNPRWKTKRSDDSRTVAAVTKELEKYDIWVAHNGQRFDVPYLRTRLMAWGLPPLPLRKLIDPVLLARNKLRLSYNSLAQVANHLGCNSKTQVSPHHWIKASMDGDSGSMDYIVNHCKRDVLVLEQVVNALKNYSTSFNTYGSGY